MLAFAGNSVLCRLALADGAIDPASFTIVRLLSGAVTLVGILWLRARNPVSPLDSGSWTSAAVLLAYAVCFSYAYVTLDAGTGALILFGCAQGTMITAALLRGERAGAIETVGWLLAAAGLAALLLPGTTAPTPQGTVLMAIAGIGWGSYTLFGRRESRPLASTAGNFVRVLLPAALLLPFVLVGVDAEASGILIALVAGSLTTGVGYVIWYAALPALTALQAALVQLSVPAIAAAAGVLFLGEALTLRLVSSAALILGGICLSLSGKYGLRPRTR
jgi:drug/metabolite transporter (DMT)-like permease